MQLQQAIELIQAARLKNEPTTWADLGCGSGLFTAALSHLLTPQSKIDAVDKQPQHLPAGTAKDIAISFRQADFEKDTLPFSGLDGFLMANALHYVKDKLSVIQKLSGYLAPDGSFIVVEYDTMQANQWVPYPIDFTHLKNSFSTAGYSHCIKLGNRPSIYRSGHIYACQLLRQ